jgi:NTE family protein
MEAAMADERSDQVILALGGGAARGLAHIGVLRGMAEDGVKIAGIAGTSMGSIIGSLAAQGLQPDELEAIFDEMDWQSVGSILVRSVVGEAFHDLLREILGEGMIEDLEMPFAAVCCDLDTGDQVVLTRGNLADSVRASSAIPGILSPIKIGGRVLVDGAVVEPLPVTVASSMGSEPLVAVNVLKPPGARVAAVRPATRPRRVGVRSVMRRRIDRWFGQHETEIAAGAEIPNRWEAVIRSFHIMQYRLAAVGSAAEVVIEPDVGRFGWFDFPRVTEIVDEGYRAYRRRFPS